MKKRTTRVVCALVVAVPFALASHSAAAKCVALGKVFDVGQKLCSQGQLSICTANGAWVNIGRC